MRRIAARAAMVVVCVGAGSVGWAAEPTRAPFTPSGVGCPADPVARVIQATVQAPGLGRGAASATAQPRVTPAAQVMRSEKADVTFEVRPSSDGGAELRATNGGLQVTKAVSPTGEFTLRLTSGTDVVSIGVTGRGTRVSRGRQTVELPRGADAPGRRPAVRRMLADSDAVVRYRRMADALMVANDRSPAALGIIITDGVLGVLGGDAGAPRRIAEFLAGDGAKRLRPAGMAIDCFTLMEQRMTEAWNDYMACWVSVSYLLFPEWFQEACALRWVVQVESYWFNFISCSGFSF